MSKHTFFNSFSSRSPETSSWAWILSAFFVLVGLSLPLPWAKVELFRARCPAAVSSNSFTTSCASSQVATLLKTVPPLPSGRNLLSRRTSLDMVGPIFLKYWIRASLELSPNPMLSRSARRDSHLTSHWKAESFPFSKPSPSSRILISFSSAVSENSRCLSRIWRYTSPGLSLTSPEVRCLR